MRLIISIIFILLNFYVPGFAANYTLEIIQPQESLSTTNRFYKAYPGVEYSVKVAVIGGTFPNTYELITNPSGMTINEDTGVISWSNPLTSGSPHSVSVKVTDSESSTDTHSWTITVTTSGFYFLDAVDGTSVAGGGTGTFANPWKTLNDMYENDKTADSYTTGFLYFMTGTYTIDTPLEDGVRMALVSYRKPMVWLAYPTESPILNVSAGYIIVYTGVDNFYVDGFEVLGISNSTGKGFSLESTGDNVTFRNNNFHGLVDQSVSNQACVFIIDASAGQFWSFTENLFHDVTGANGVEAYKAERVLFEDNTFYDFSAGTQSGHALAPKMSYRYWFIRDNLFYDCDTWSIWADGYTTSGACEHIDISFNLVKTAGTYAFQANYDDGEQGIVYIHRNTFVGPVDVKWAKTGRGPYNFYNNVIINTAEDITCTSCTDETIITDTDNLKGSSSDNIIDSSGNLLGAYRTSYLGIRGYEISGASTGGIVKLGVGKPVTIGNGVIVNIGE